MCINDTGSWVIFLVKNFFVYGTNSLIDPDFIKDGKPT